MDALIFSALILNMVESRFKIFGYLGDILIILLSDMGGNIDGIPQGNVL